MKVAEALAHNVKRLRKERGFRTQEGLAEKSGLSVVSIARIESGASYPTEATVAAIARALAVEETLLFVSSGDRGNISPEQALEVLAQAVGMDLKGKMSLRATQCRTIGAIPPKIIDSLAQLDWSNRNVLTAFETVLEGLLAQSRAQKRKNN